MTRPDDESLARREDEALRWLWRLDRGLSPAEQDELFDWLASDPANRRALSRHRSAWRRLDRLSDWRPEHAERPNPDLLAPRGKRVIRLRGLLRPLAAAAVLAFGAGLCWRVNPPHAPGPGERAISYENRRMLADGTSVKLNLGGELEVLFTKSERRIRLRRGEGFFIVTKDPSRPFIVEAEGVEVRAVGTAFNINLGSRAVEVLVAEGAVLVETPSATTGGPPEPALTRPTALEASQRTTVTRGSETGPRAVTTLSRPDLKRALSWQHGIMTFDQRPLSAIVAELNLLNEQQMVIRDPKIGAMLFSGTIRSDNVAGFLRLLESGFQVRSEQVATDKIVLRSR